MSKRGRTGSALLAAIALFTAMLWPSRVYAYSPTSDAPPAIERTCDDRTTLAGLVNAEAGAQPVHSRTVDGQFYGGQIAVAQVFVKHAERNQSTVCWLANFTGISSVPAYVRSHPNSYQASRYHFPPEELYTLAGQVLRHELPDETGGAMFFDGSLDGMSIIFSN